MRSTGLTAVCAIGICLAVLGMLGFTGGCLGLLFQSAIQEFAVQMQPGMPGGQLGETQQQMAAVQARWLPYSIANVALNAIASGLLLVGAILGLRMNPRTNHWFVPGLICGVLQAILYFGTTAGVQHDLQPLMAQQFALSMRQGGAAPPPAAAAAMSSAMKMSSAFAIAFAGGWALLQVVYYSTAIWYLMRREVRNLFTPPTLDALAAEPTIGGMP
jgi:hypothetical protein